MQISIANAIQVARRIGSAASIITNGLKMWLGFKTSEVVGRELVVNGDFSDGEAAWTFGGGWSVNAQNQATTQGVSQTPISQAVLVNGTNRLTLLNRVVHFFTLTTQSLVKKEHF